MKKYTHNECCRIMDHYIFQSDYDIVTRREHIRRTLKNKYGVNASYYLHPDDRAEFCNDLISITPKIKSTFWEGLILHVLIVFGIIGVILIIIFYGN